MPQQQPPRLLDRVRHALRVKHYSRRTENSYVNWIKRFILFHHKQHPQQMNSLEIEQFLTDLAVEKNVSPSTQNQALAALLFLYQEVLHKPLERRIDAVRAKKRHRLPVVMSKAEVARLIVGLPENYHLMAKLLYGSGLRLMECVRLRVKDVDFDQHQLIVRDGKGGKDRDTLLPDSLCAPLRRQLRYAKALHDNDLERGSTGASPYLTPWNANIQTPAESGAGNMSFPRTSSQKTRARTKLAAIMWTRAVYKRRSGQRPRRSGLLSLSVAEPSGTALPRTY
jgi:integrase